MKIILSALVAVCCSVSNIASAHDLSRTPDQNQNVLKPEVLQSIYLSKELPGMDGRELRMRKVVLQPGGVIAPHSHVDRPAIVYVLQGRVREHRSDHDEPIEYCSGDLIINY